MARYVPAGKRGHGKAALSVCDSAGAGRAIVGGECFQPPREQANEQPPRLGRVVADEVVTPEAAGDGADGLVQTGAPRNLKWPLRPARHQPGVQAGKDRQLESGPAAAAGRVSSSEVMTRVIATSS
jgi:hypothetical protein